MSIILALVCRCSGLSSSPVPMVGGIAVAICCYIERSSCAGSSSVRVTAISVQGSRHRQPRAPCLCNAEGLRLKSKLNLAFQSKYTFMKRWSNYRSSKWSLILKLVDVEGDELGPDT